MVLRPVYVVFSHTNTRFGKLIRIATRGEYNHVSLALRRDLCRMYSFARYKKDAPFWGGFVTETPARFLDGGDVKIKVARLLLPEQEYSGLIRRLDDFARRDRDMLYNHIGAAASFFKRRIHIRGCYICFEFVAETLGYSGVRTIRQFERALADTVIYEGSFSEFTQSRWGKSTDYFTPQKPLSATYETVRELAREVGRAIF